MALGNKQRQRIWRDYFESILIAVFLALFVRSYVMTGYKVPTTSMAPTLRPGDFIFSYRLPFGIHLPFSGKKILVNPPKHGDIVVFTFPEQPRVNYAKRVIGLPGDRIHIIEGQLSINGKKLEYDAKEIKSVSDMPGAETQELFEEKNHGPNHLVLYQKNSVKKSFGPLIVPPGEVFLLGDNRDASDDSRYWGTVPIEKIEGKVLFIWMSLDWSDRWGGDRFPSLRADRSFSVVH